MAEQNQHLQTLEDIKRMMQRSSKFISLSGLSGLAAGFWALVGAYFAYDWIVEYYNNNGEAGLTGPSFQNLKLNVLLLACAILVLSLLSAFFFTWRKAEGAKMPLWDHTSKNLVWNFLIPLATGGFFILAMLQYDEWRFVASACLIFYGLALVNSSKYTLSEVRYLGMLEIILGLIATQFVTYGLHFWAFGFGVMHIIYGFAMWWKYERNPVEEKNG